jgi:hypothetical protein
MPAARCGESAGGVSLRGWLTRKRNKRGAIVVGVVAATVFAILDATEVLSTFHWAFWFILVCVADFIGFAYTVLRSDGSTDH